MMRKLPLIHSDALYEAIESDKVELLDKVIEKENLREKFIIDPSALMLAIEVGGEACIKRIIALQGDVNLVNRIAVNSDCCNGVRRTALQFAAEKYYSVTDQKKYVAIIKLLIQAGADVNAPFGSNNLESTVLTTILDGAGKWSYAIDLSLLSYLIKEKANVNQTYGDRAISPIMAALTADNNAEAIDILIKAGANVDYQNSNGQTAIMYALMLRGDNSSAIKKLVEAGADLEIPCTRGHPENRRALDFAIEIKSLRYVALLLEHQAVIHDPQALYEFLKSCDTRSPKLLGALSSCCKQRKREYPIYDEIEAYLTKLQHAHNPYKKNTNSVLTDEVNKFLIPDLTNIVVGYDDYTDRMPEDAYPSYLKEQELLEKKLAEDQRLAKIKINTLRGICNSYKNYLEKKFKPYAKKPVDAVHLPESGKKIFNKLKLVDELLGCLKGEAESNLRDFQDTLKNNKYILEKHRDSSFIRFIKQIAACLLRKTLTAKLGIWQVKGKEVVRQLNEVFSETRMPNSKK